ncbi:hypothetical protein HA402_008871 [Bradysia odoriphaga]|nr:hypothetical protein HA402_008871 [Bradysia odoriphaga]
MLPMTRFTNPDELLTAMASHDAVVVAFVNLLVHRSYYSSFYKTAVKWTEKDPNQEVLYGVVTGDAMKQFGVESTPVVRMYLWNDTIEYTNNTWTQPELSKFVSTNIHQVSAWVSPPGTKAATLAPYFMRGPVVLLFTPRIHYAESNDAYAMLRQAALQYYNCPSTNEIWIREMSREYMTQQRIKYQQEHKTFLEQCRHLIKTDRTSLRCAQSTVSVTFANIVNSSNDPGQRIFGPMNANEGVISHRYSKYKVDSCDAITANRFVDVADEEMDQQSSETLTKRELKRKCESFVDEENVNFFIETEHEEDFESIAGLSCKSNQSLSFLAMDSLVYNTFAERLGLNVLKRRSKTGLVIVDYENESTFVLKQAVNTRNVINFIGKFHNKTLSRHLKSSSRQQATSSSSDMRRYVSIKRTFTLKDINSDNFNDYVVLSNKTVVVLFYSTQCALCSLMSHTLMMASKMLQDIDRIDFVRIDGDQNDLPWQYTLDKFPALLIFPENRKMESRIFSTNHQVNIQNVLGFLLANIDRPLRLHALALICQNTHKPFLHDDCFRVLRTEITDSISFNLKQWRKIPHQRGQIYRRLQILQRMYLELVRINVSCDFSELIVSVSDIRRVWRQ